MRPELQTEVDRLKAVLEKNGQSFETAEPVPADALAHYEAKMNVRLDADLRDLWLLSNGSGNATWFACKTDELLPFNFVTLEEIQDMWPEGSVVGEPQFDPAELGNEDPRIQAGYLEHPGWIPFADFSNGNATVFFDTAPTAQGHYGQIIAYQHDPDAMYYIADSFLDFFRQSNDALEAQEQDFFE